ncbi:MAG: 1-acyl-sn-glycerol-3-phosphate acyltransferase [Planctomycetes bacterium]|nr:1-acyl-sn-glycerol-3-phosphate acyltransferase [Planctomycetota bacterium]
MAPTPGKERLIKRIWHSIARLLCSGIMCTLYRVRAYGMKHVPRKGPVIILCSHQCYLDPIFVQSWVPRNFHFIARQTLWKSKFLAALLNTLYVVPIKQGQGDIAAMRTIIAKLKAGNAVCLFPEGERTFDGMISDVKPGFGLISRRSGAGVVPVVLEGAFECWPRMKKFPKLGKVTVSFGEMITTEEIKRLGDREFAKFLTHRLRQMHNELRLKIGREPFNYPGEES